MTRIQRFTSGAPWEEMFGYCRAVRAGDWIEVAGTTATDDGIVLHHNDAYNQTIFVLAKIEKALKQAGAEMRDVVRTRMFVTDISRWAEFGRAHAEFFRECKPASTMVEVNGLIDQDMLIEIEVTAYAGRTNI
jgi:enamine deaminase RidA (YjgF/YER057c/UK114 family)